MQRLHFRSLTGFSALMVLFFACVLACGPALSQGEFESPETGQVRKLEKQVQELQTQIDALQADAARNRNNYNTASGGAVAFLTGAFCALWAQNTRRNPWLWFFFGLFCSCVPLLILLYMNATDAKDAPPAA